MITYQEESISVIIDEGKELFTEHWKEIAQLKDKVPLDPDYGSYLALEQYGKVHVVTVRDGSKLVGYCVSSLSPHMHYASTLFAVNDILYISPEYRMGRVGMALLQKAEEFLVAKGVEVILIHTKVSHDFSPLAERLGYTFSEKVLSKYVGGK